MDRLNEAIPGLLLRWYGQGHRELPWRRDREPYHVWLSEIMLQQTRVEAVRSYYERFLRELPTVQALAVCPPDRLRKLWEGLGYYTRVRNLQLAAQKITGELGGRFPDTVEGIRALPGVGVYTAGAIASICFGLPEPAVDGNVLRVLARVTDDHRVVTQPAVKEEYAARLREIYPRDAAGPFTQSLMELGATVCPPSGQARCEECPLEGLCLARLRGTQASLPVRAAKKERRAEEKTVFLLRCGGKLAVRKRPETGLLAGLWELPNVPGRLDERQALEQAAAWGAEPRELVYRQERTHIFTHIRWELRAYEILCSREPDVFVWADEARLGRDIALPTAFKMFL